jgi:hypothetical protein
MGENSINRGVGLTAGSAGNKPLPFGSTENGAPMMPSPARMKQDVEALCRYMRHSHNMQDLNASADYIRKAFEATGLKVEEQRFDIEGRTYRNLMVSFGPPQAARYVVGAHYDVQGNQPGADDNASGVAGLLELARLLQANKPNLQHRLDLVAYTLEEHPYPTQGSRIHARSLYDGHVPVKGMISLEMIGFYSDEPGSQQYPIKALKWLYPDRGNFIGVIGYGGQALGMVRKTGKALRTYGDIPVRSLYSPINTAGLDRSDHSSFSNLGYPAVMVTDTANYRNPHYHQKSDTVDKLDFAKMAEVVKGVYGFTQAL